MACPTVCPKLSSRRRPRSRSSSSTMRAFTTRARATTSSSRGERPSRAGFSSSRIPSSSGVADDPALDHLGEAGPELPRRQAVQPLRRDQDRRRLVEGADEVLVLAEVQARLPTHAGIDLGQERRRDLHEADPPLPRGRGEPGDVPEHPAAEGRQRPVAPHLLGQQVVVDAKEGLVRLGRLASLQLEHVDVDAGRAQAGQQVPRPGLPGAPVRHQRPRRRRPAAHDASADPSPARGRSAPDRSGHPA